MLQVYPNAIKVRCVIIAAIYSCTEYLFTLMERGASYTSLAQCWCNLLYVPVLLDLYGWVFGHSFALYLLLFPINVWVMEVVMERLIVLVHGRNVAWSYLDYADELLHGCVRLGHGVFWLVLGVIAFFMYPVLCAFTAQVCG